MKTDRKNPDSYGTVFHFYSDRFRRKKQERDGNEMAYGGNGNETDSGPVRFYRNTPRIVSVD